MAKICSNEMKRRLILSYVQDISDGKPWRHGHHEMVNEYREIGGEWPEKVKGMLTLHEVTSGLVNTEEEMKQLAMRALLEYSEGGSPLAGKEGRRSLSYSDGAKGAIYCLRDFVIQSSGLSVPKHLKGEKRLNMTPDNIKELSQSATPQAIELVRKRLCNPDNPILTKSLFLNDNPENGFVMSINLNGLNQCKERILTIIIERKINGNTHLSTYSFG